MNSHVHRFYQKYADEETPIRVYHEVIALHEEPRLPWEEIAARAPSLPKGWYELAGLNPKDRIEFTRAYWTSTLPFSPSSHAMIEKFFDALDDIGVYLTKRYFDSAFEAEIVYSLKNNSCFFHGSPPCPADEIERLKIFYEGLLPEDYLAFLKIHDGFSKHTDTGLIKTKHLREVSDQMRAELEQFNRKLKSGAKQIDPDDLFPFYESFGQPSFQCFFAGWTPSGEVGNVYFSLFEKVISDVQKRESPQDNLAFATFLEWLMFYLESIE